MIEAPELGRLPGIRHGFFTREGGVSGGIYASLNCGLGSDDVAGHVLENRARVAARLGASADRLVSPYQTHSADAVHAEVAWPRDAAPRADGVVTATRGLAIGISTADCAPVLFADPEAGVVGGAHAGWRGAFSGVLEATVERMIGLGATRANITAVVGPAISARSYEVGEEFEARFLAEDPGFAEYFERPSRDSRPHFALSRFACDRLKAAGVGCVADVDVCTYEDERRLFSYRRTVHRGEPDYGRQISAILLT